MIILKITKTEPNPKFDQEYEEYRKNRNGYQFDNGNGAVPRKEFPVGILEVEITDQQFEAIRKAVIEKF